MRLDLPLKGGDFGVEHGQDGGLGADGGRVRGGYHRRLAEVLGTQRRLDRRCPGGDVTAATGAAQCRGDLCDGQPGRCGRIGRFAQQFQRIGRGQVVEGDHGGGEEVQQRPAQPQRVAGAFPDQRLVRPGKHLDRLGQGAVAGDRA